MVFQVIDGLQSSWTNYLHKTLSGLVVYLLTSLAADLKIW
jgi:hypothetical protein